ncbi:hypothetical protein BCD67_21710 [Oscillatoriales cyanobacterium USR001]|nr:hypothetical protein BCD67_21710 [Oscillatoriales cyanobacterium USR001]
MFITFTENVIELQEWSTKKELIYSLSQCDLGSILLNEEDDYEQKFYAAIVRPQTSGLHYFGIGICSEGHGLKPNLLINPELDMIMFGYNKEVVGVNLKNRQIAFRIKLNSLFYYFLPLKNQGIVLIVQEVDITAITELGKEIWRYGKDIITQTTIEGEKLYLNFMDESPACLNILNGELVRV